MIVYRIKVNAHDERRTVFLRYSSDCTRMLFTSFIGDFQTMSGVAFANPEATLANAPFIAHEESMNH